MRTQRAKAAVSSGPVHTSFPPITPRQRWARSPSLVGPFQSPGAGDAGGVCPEFVQFPGKQDRRPPWPKCTRDSAWRAGFWSRERRWATVSCVFNHTPLMGHQLIQVTERLLIKTNDVSLQTKPAPQWLHRFWKESRLEGEPAECRQGVVTSHT